MCFKVFREGRRKRQCGVWGEVALDKKLIFTTHHYVKIESS